MEVRWYEWIDWKWFATLSLTVGVGAILSLIGTVRDFLTP